MKHTEKFFPGVRNTNTYYQYWLPEEKPKAILLIVHGLVEHSGRYMNVVNYFVPRGYAVYSFDHIGHGKSGGKRAYIEQFKDFTDTIKVYFDLIRGWNPDTPVIIFGHSMGGLISTNYLLDYQSELSAAVISGPPLVLPNAISVLSGEILSKLMPWIGLLRINPDDISREKSVVQAYIDDPLVNNDRISARLLNEIVKGMKRVSSEVSQITLPLMIVHGGADKLAAPAGSQMLFDKASSQKKAIKIYDGLYHEVLNEPEREQVLEDIAVKLDEFLN
ncbi:MAG: alpha/beta hydrolase [Candidatus Magnetomorum sp.]|nr:alpha/beta hydrolase [Candidatus Magnetomorum sp.]